MPRLNTLKVLLPLAEMITYANHAGGSDTVVISRRIQGGGGALLLKSMLILGGAAPKIFLMICKISFSYKSSLHRDTETRFGR